MRIVKRADGRPVGRAHGGRFEVRVKPVNFFRRAKGFSIDAGAITDAARDCSTILLIEEDGAAWTISIPDFLAVAQRISFGFGLKLAAPMSAYRRVGGVEQLSLITIPPQPKAHDSSYAGERH